MSTIFAFAGKNFSFTSTGNGVSINFKQTSNLERKWIAFIEDFKIRGNKFLKEEGSNFCHAMADVSLPRSKNTAITANNAVGKYAAENAILAKVAFKHWSEKSALWWLLGGYIPQYEYVKKQTGFNWNSRILSNLDNNRNYPLMLRYLFKKGLNVPSDIPKDPQFIRNKADLPTFIKWKSMYKSGTMRGPYYVKDRASINNISKEKSLYNYASLVINGWLMAGKDLGNKVTSVKKVTWNYGKGLGNGYAKIRKRGKGSVSSELTLELEIFNEYGNLNGVFNSSYTQSAYRSMMNKFFEKEKELFRTLVNNFNSYNP